MKNNKKDLLTWIIAGTVSFVILLFSYLKLLPITLVETLGFITGAATVWLTVKQNIWCWPIGIANNIFFIILFFNARLFADMSLQVIYIVLSLLGWYWWLKGGKNNTVLRVSRISLRHALVLLSIIVIATYAMEQYLTSINDASPLFDGLTTVLSLVAQYLLTRKYLENWFVWMSADIIYIWLYFVRDLYLTGVLYMIFFLMCIAGYKAWNASLKERRA
jgi:nicotinamide mononucleotide transporter